MELGSKEWEYAILDRLKEKIELTGWKEKAIRNAVSALRAERLRPYRYVGYTDRLHIVTVDLGGMLADTLKTVIDMEYPDLVIACSRLTGAVQ